MNYEEVNFKIEKVWIAIFNLTNLHIRAAIWLLIFQLRKV